MKLPNDWFSEQFVTEVKFKLTVWVFIRKLESFSKPCDLQLPAFVRLTTEFLPAAVTCRTRNVCCVVVKYSINRRRQRRLPNKANKRESVVHERR